MSLSELEKMRIADAVEAQRPLIERCGKLEAALKMAKEALRKCYSKLRAESIRGNLDPSLEEQEAREALEQIEKGEK